MAVGGGDWRRPGIGRLIRGGVGYVPAERLVEGMIAPQPVAWNMALPSGDIYSTRGGFWRGGREARTARAMIERLGIRADAPRTPCNRLSGGNQQKVVLARWLARPLGALILDNPTRGVDAGAKSEIYALVRDLTDRGVGVVLITDELLELIGLSNRIVILRHWRIARMLEAPAEAKPGEQALVEAMLSDPAGDRAAA